MTKYYRVIVETSEKDKPYDFEMSAAIMVAEYFKTDIVFLRPTSLKSPDLKIRNQIWELKSPMGNSKNTIKNNIHTARKQSLNLIIDLRRCKLNENKALANIRDCYKKRKRRVGRYIIINKGGKILTSQRYFSMIISNKALKILQCIQ